MLLCEIFDHIDIDQGRKIAYEVSLSATNSSKKKRNTNQLKGKKDAEMKESNKSQVTELASDNIEEKDGDDDDGEGRMVDEIITSGMDYELPSQDDLIRRAFAGDDVEEDFEMTKQEILNGENPEPEKPVLLPGWGQWTHIQRDRGLPSWMLEDERAKKKRDQDLRRRPDAHFKDVIISEKVDKKAEKLQTKVLPYPFKDKEHFERSNRMPLGPEFNLGTTIGALNRPQILGTPRHVDWAIYSHTWGPLHLSPGKALFIFVNNTLPQTSSLIESVYESFKDEDGFLYMCYSSEKTFGNMNSF